jgi:hypothetical protein
VLDDLALLFGHAAAERERKQRDKCIIIGKERREYGDTRDILSRPPGRRQE